MSGRGSNCLWTQLDGHTTIQPIRAVHPVFPWQAGDMFVLSGISGEPKLLVLEKKLA